jgi:hypothetical protein
VLFLELLVLPYGHTNARTLTHDRWRSATPIYTTSLRCSQIKAWKAGHKGECAAAPRPVNERDVMAFPNTDTRTAVTPDQERVLGRLKKKCAVADWQGVLELERAGREVATALRTRDRHKAALVYCVLANAYQSLDNHSKAIEYHTYCLEIAKEVGERKGEGLTNGDIGIAYQSLGEHSKAIEYHTQHLAIAKELGHRYNSHTHTHTHTHTHVCMYVCMYVCI